MPEPDAQLVANTLTRWARGDLFSAAGPKVVVIDERHTEWLRSDRSGLVSRETLVLVRARKARDSFDGPVGTWITCTGGLDDPGDELQVGKDMWLQNVDFFSTRYMSVAGPTVVRLADAEDARALTNAVAQDRVEDALLHTAVEIGDRCLLTDRPCTTSGGIPRLHVSRSGELRTVSGGAVLGHVGDDLVSLAERARELAAAGVDPCGSDDVQTALRDVSASDRRFFLNAIDALRTMMLRTGRPWRVSGLGSRFTDAAGSTRSNPEVLLMWSGDDHVIFDATQRRAFAVPKSTAGLADVVLSSSSKDNARSEVAALGLTDADPRAAIEALMVAFADRGVDLVGQP